MKKILNTLNKKVTITEKNGNWHSLATALRHRASMHFTAGYRHSVRHGQCCMMHSHESVEIVFHQAGKGITRIKNGPTIAFDEHDVVIYGPNIEHDQVMDMNGVDVCVHLNMNLDLEAVDLGVLHVPAVTRPILVEEILSLSMSQSGAESQQQAILNHRASAVMLSLLCHQDSMEEQKSVNASARHAASAVEYIRQNFSQIESLTEVANHLGLSSDRLRHSFREERGESLIDYLISIRIGRAKFLLRNTGLPLKQVATMVGYKNEFYFSRVFRQQTGIPPAAYRQQ